MNLWVWFEVQEFNQFLFRLLKTIHVTLELLSNNVVDDDDDDDDDDDEVDDEVHDEYVWITVPF